MGNYNATGNWNILLKGFYFAVIPAKWNVPLKDGYFAVMLANWNVLVKECYFAVIWKDSDKSVYLLLYQLSEAFWL